MLTEQELSSLLLRIEGETLDFKSEGYNFSEKAARLSLIKDILSMANTPRDQAAHIVLGVKKFADGTFDLTGVDNHPDEADLQQQFQDRVYPLPSFTYYPFSFQGKSLGVIEIAPARVGPCVPIRDFDKTLRERQIYLRKGSRNSIAMPEDVHRIVNWVRGRQPASMKPEDESPAWIEFLSATNSFDPLWRYFLIASPIRQDHRGLLSELGRLPWVCVFDFDTDSEKTGLLKEAGSELQKHRALHRVVKGERPSINARNATRWFFSRGLTGRDASLASGSWGEWKREYGREVRAQLDLVAKDIAPTPLTCIILWDEPLLKRYLQSTLEAFLDTFGSTVEFILVIPEGEELDVLSSDFDATTVSIALHQLCSGLRVLQKHEALTEGDVLFPSSSAAPIEIESSKITWLSEDFELAHLNIGRTPSDDRLACRDFLRGALIEWYEVGLHCDVGRDLTAEIDQQLRIDLRQKRTVRVNLFHSPGAGGTTLARRLVWDLHRSYPCVILSRYAPESTAEKLYHLASLTGLGILVISDGAHVADRQIDELFTDLRSRQIPAVVVQVLRRFSSQQRRKRAFHLPAKLNTSEASRFVDIYSRTHPENRNALMRLSVSDDERLCTPFYFGLQCFGKDFLGLEPYVQRRISDLESVARKLLLLIAFVHRYAQHPLPAQIFVDFLGTPRSRPVRLDKVLPSSTLELLTEENDGVWRTAHNIVSIEILEQTLSVGITDRRLWSQSLSDTALSFLDICNDCSGTHSEELLEIMGRLFVYRDNVDLLGTERSSSQQFSHLIQEIPSREGRLRVLQQLVDFFPEEAHFQAHLGRFYSIVMKDYEKAENCLDKAITIQDQDPLLHHMKGMALRKRVEGFIGEREDLNRVIEFSVLATESFAVARELRPDDEHAYISEVQLLVKVLDYAGREHGGGIMAYLASGAAPSFIRDAFERSEYLLEQVRRNREGEHADSYEKDCRARIDILYGAHDRALQVWDSLLVRGGVYKPPMRRQIIRTYLARRGRTWSSMKPKEARRSLELLDNNLTEDPYNERDLRLWVQAVRYAPTSPSIEAVIERVAYWRARAGTLDAVYYLYIFSALLGIEGSKVHREEARQFMRECSQMSRRQRNRRKSFEWLGHDQGLKALVHQSELGDWHHDVDFWEKGDRLRRVPARIVRIDGPQAGIVEVRGGIDAFFVPGQGNFQKGNAENENVVCHLGFSYDGPRAWNVLKAE